MGWFYIVLILVIGNAFLIENSLTVLKLKVKLFFTRNKVQAAYNKSTIFMQKNIPYGLNRMSK